MPEKLSNQLLILSQRPDATTVAGYRTWQSLGRQVRRGVKGIGIFGYSTKTSVQQVTDENGTTDEKTSTRTFFPVRTVFDISDTDGEDIRVPTDVRNAGTSPAAMSTQVYEQISGWLTRQEWDVQRVEISGSARGYTNHTERLVRVAVGLDDINAARVLLHEAAHVTLHGPDSGFITSEQYAASRTHRGTAEIQADGAAYVLADLLGTGHRTGHHRVRGRLGSRRGGHPHRRRRDHRSGPRDRRCHPPRGQHHRRGNRPGPLTATVRPAVLPCPLPSKAGPRVAAIGHFRGTWVGTTRYPPRRAHRIASSTAPTGRGARWGRWVFGALA